MDIIVYKKSNLSYMNKETNRVSVTRHQQTSVYTKIPKRVEIIMDRKQEEESNKRVAKQQHRVFQTTVFVSKRGRQL